jgi:hypothetical protein
MTLSGILNGELPKFHSDSVIFFNLIHKWSNIRYCFTENPHTTHEVPLHDLKV